MYVLYMCIPTHVHLTTKVQDALIARYQVMQHVDHVGLHLRLCAWRAS